MRIIIHETYEYEVEADSAGEALELFDRYICSSSNLTRELTGVEFNQNYMHTYDTEGREL